MAALLPLLGAVAVMLTNSLELRASEAEYWLTQKETDLGIENSKKLLLEKINLEEAGGAERVAAFSPLSALSIISQETMSGDLCTRIDVFRLDYPVALSSASRARLPRMMSVTEDYVDEKGRIVRKEPKRYYLIRSQAARNTNDTLGIAFEECVELSYDRAEKKTYARTLYFRRVSQ